jgi:Pyruvate phosphate dikinase, AMP/ATP-binding domain
MIETKPHSTDLPAFDRNFWDGTFTFTRIGSGSLGGKAGALAFVKDLLAAAIDPAVYPGVEVNVPTMAVVATGCFTEFVRLNHLSDLNFDEMLDDHIGYAFQQADFPAELLGDLRALSEQVKTPLAIRSSSLLEDALDRPFAGVYATKMIPNNQLDPDTRFRKLVEAIKFVYASTYFRVARSYNFYSSPPAMPEDGVVSLALGLGKTIVDGGITWTYSPAYPRKPPPFASVNDMFRGTQTEFWAVNMGKPPVYDPVSETEHMVRGNLSDAEADETLRFVASTFDPTRNRVIPGTGPRGGRIIDFAPLLVLEQFPLNNIIRALLAAAENTTSAKVEVEFAVTMEQPSNEAPSLRFGFLQVRPMAVSSEVVEVSAEELTAPRTIVASDRVMGNGIEPEIHDIVYVRPENFSPLRTPEIAQDLEMINRKLQGEGRPYVLIGFGRWGSSHPSLGIPVDWSQISGARTIVEATLPEINVELSQGSHFFHNLSSFRATYMMVRHDGPFPIQWDWLNRQPIVNESELVRHIRPKVPVTVRVDGRAARGVVMAGGLSSKNGKES